MEHQLLGLGVICWNDSGNHKRFPRRDGKGRVVEAYGVNLMPAVDLIQKMKTFEAEHEAYELAYDLANNRLTRERRRCRGLLQHLKEKGVDGIEVLEVEASELIGGIKSGAGRTLSHIHSVTVALAELIVRLVDMLGVRNPSPAVGRAPDSVCQGTESCGTHRAHPESDRQYSTDGATPERRTTVDRRCRGDGLRQEDAEREYPDKPVTPTDNQPPEIESRKKRNLHPCGSGEELFAKLDEMGLVRIAREVVLPRLQGRFRRKDLLSVAERLGVDIGIRKTTWHEACRVFGRWEATAVMIMLAEKHRRGLVNYPDGYLRGCVGKRRSGAFDIWGMFIGLSKQNAQF